MTSAIPRNTTRGLWIPNIALSAAIIYLINAFFAFLFCCQVNFEIDLELTGNDWLQKITQPNFDVTKKKENEEKKKKGQIKVI